MISRRNFLKKSLGGVTVAAASVSILHCYSDDDSNSIFDPTDANANSPVQATSINKHNHTVSEVSLTAGIQTISLSGGHNHNVNITDAHINTLKVSGGTVTVASSTTDSHAHQVTFTNVTKA